MVTETRERILNASLDLFSVYGYASVSTRQIAEAASLSEPTLFRHFGSKRALYAATFLRFVIRPSKETILSGISGGDLEADILQVARAIASLVVSNDKIVRMSIKDVVTFEEIDNELRHHPEEMVEIVASFFKTAIPEPPIETERLARHFVLTLFGMALNFLALDMLGAPYGLDACVADYGRLFYRAMLSR